MCPLTGRLAGRAGWDLRRRRLAGARAVRPGSAAAAAVRVVGARVHVERRPRRRRRRVVGIVVEALRWQRAARGGYNRMGLGGTPNYEELIAGDPALAGSAAGHQLSYC